MLWTLTDISNDFSKFLILSVSTISIINIIPLAYLLNLSAQIGEKLVNLFLIFYHIISELFESVFLGVQVIIEDALLFRNDLLEKIYLIASSCHDFYQCVHRKYNLLCSSISTLLQFLSEFFHFGLNLISWFGRLVIILYQFLQSLGFTLWISFSSIPNLIIDFYVECKNVIINFVKEFSILVFQVLGYIIESLYNCEMKPILGLILGIFLITGIYVKLNDICAIFLQLMLRLYCLVKIMFTKIFNSRSIESNGSQEDISNNKIHDEKLCVICNDRPREIILLPCKHFCICSNCSNAIAVRQLPCPLCRSHISNTLKVYW